MTSRRKPCNKNFIAVYIIFIGNSPYIRNRLCKLTGCRRPCGRRDRIIKHKGMKTRRTVFKCNRLALNRRCAAIRAPRAHYNRTFYTPTVRNISLIQRICGQSCLSRRRLYPHRSIININIYHFVYHVLYIPLICFLIYRMSQCNGFPR